MLASRNPLLEPRAGDVLAFLVAHPDDESIFTGGTIASAAAAGATTVVIMATLGELGGRLEPAAVAATRKDELRRACAVLGVSEQRFLGGEGRWTDSGHPARASQADALAHNIAPAAGALRALLWRLRPEVLVTFDERGCTGHPDHVACHAIAVAAASELPRLHGLATIADPLLPPADGELLTVDVATFRRRRARAIGCHDSQVAGAVCDPSRVALLDPAGAVARYLPRVIARDRERYAWIPAARLRARDAA